MSKISKDSENGINEIIKFILEFYKKESVNQELETFTELILISKIVYNRLKMSKGIKSKDDKFIKLAKNKILTRIKDDEYYELVKNLLNDNDCLKNNSFN